MDIIAKIAEELKIRVKQVEAAVSLIDEGNTIPFIARYRKEATGSLDDEKLRELGEKLEFYRALDARRADVQRLIDEQGKLTEELVNAIENAQTLSELEDIYRPYRPKRRTRASVAAEAGLTPLAELMLEQRKDVDIVAEAENYLNPEKKINNATDALNMAIHGTVRTGDHVITTLLEHNSVLRPLSELSRSGAITLTLVPPDAHGQICAEDIERAMLPHTRLVAMTHMSNVLGTVQDAAAIGALCAKHGVYLLLDKAHRGNCLYCELCC